jgi:hypothetical protein
MNYKESAPYSQNSSNEDFLKDIRNQHTKLIKLSYDAELLSLQKNLFKFESSIEKYPTISKLAIYYEAKLLESEKKLKLISDEWKDPVLVHYEALADFFDEVDRFYTSPLSYLQLKKDLCNSKIDHDLIFDLAYFSFLIRYPALYFPIQEGYSEFDDCVLDQTKEYEKIKHLFL